VNPEPERAVLKIARLAAIAALLAPHAARAQSAPMTPELAAVVEAAKKEGVLLIRSTNTVLGGPEGAKVARDGIKRAFGVDLDVKWSPGPAYGPMAAILNQEKQAGRKASNDVFAATAVQLATYVDQGLFRTIDWAKLMPARVTPDLSEADGRMLRYRTVLPAILYNTAEAKWAAGIKSFDEVLDPKLKGKFYTTPILAGFDVMLSDQKWGVAGTTERIRKLARQVAGLAGCEAADRVASGEIPALVVECGNGVPNTRQYRNEKVLAAHIIPDMAQKRYNYLVVPTHAEHPNAGVLYALYVMTAEGQERLPWDFMGSDYDSFPGSRTRKYIDELERDGASFVDVTYDWWRSHPGIDRINQDLMKIVREP
jgi:ABC-type Fe3+ transport system substrate-binding protein